MMKRWRLASVLMLAAALLLTACGSQQPAAKPAPAPSAPAPSGSSAPAAAPAAAAKAPAAAPAKPKPELSKLNMGLSVTTVAFLPIYVAAEKGFFKDEGVDVTLQTFQGGTENLQALVGGAIQVGGGAATEPIQAVAAGRKIKTIFEVTNFPSNHWWAQKSIKDWAGMKGKTFGVSRLGSQSDVLFRWIAKKQNLNPDKDVKILAAGGLNERLAALKSGGLDGAELTQPTSFMAEKEGLTLLGRLLDSIPKWPNEVIYATDDFIAKNPETLKAIVRALNRAAKLTKDNEAEAIAVAMKAAKLSDENARLGYKAYQNYFPPTGEYSMAGWDFAQQLMVDGGEIKQKFPMNQLAVETFVNYAKTLK